MEAGLTRQDAPPPTAQQSDDVPVAGSKKRVRAGTARREATSLALPDDLLQILPAEPDVLLNPSEVHLFAPHKHAVDP